MSRNSVFHRFKLPLKIKIKIFFATEPQRVKGTGAEGGRTSRPNASSTFGCYSNK